MQITQFYLFSIDFYLKNFFIQNPGSKDSDAIGVHNCFVTSFKWFCSFFVTVNNHCNTFFLHTNSYSMPPIKTNKHKCNFAVIYVFKTRSLCSQHDRLCTSPVTNQILNVSIYFLLSYVHKCIRFVYPLHIFCPLVQRNLIYSSL